MLAVRGKIEQFRISLQNRYATLAEEADLSIQAMKDNLTIIITKCAIAVRGRIVRRDSGKLSQEKKNLIKKSKA